MKLICNRAALAEALAATGIVAASRTPKPILQCVRITAEKDLLTLTAYDQEVGLRYRVKEVEVTQTGEVLVPSDRLVGIVRESMDETLTFESKDDKLHVRGRDSHFQIVGQSVREFPPVPDAEGDATFVVKLGALRSAVEKTIFAAAKESTRYAINGVLWQKKGKALQLVATDGRRLALSSASLEKSVGDDTQAIIPTKTLNLLLRLHFDADEDMEARLTPNQVILRTDRATISSVLVEGSFPKWEDVVPRDNDKKLQVETGGMLSAVKRAALLASIESKGVALAIEGKSLELSGRSAEQGEARVKLEVEYGGPGLKIGFNPEFLVDALKVCEDTVTLELKDSSRPGILRSGRDFQYVVMPVNLS